MSNGLWKIGLGVGLLLTVGSVIVGIKETNDFKEASTPEYLKFEDDSNEEESEE